MLAVAAESFQLVAGGDLAQAALRRLARQPGQKAGHRGAVAAMRGARAVEFDRVLAGFWQQTGVGGAMDRTARRREPVEYPGGCRRRVGLHPRARDGERVEGGAEMSRRLDADRVAEMAVETGGELAAVDEQPDAAVGAQDRE